MILRSRSLAYFEICEKLLVDKWKYVWNDQQKVPFMYSNEILSSSEPIEWVGFEDAKSIEIKSKYIIDNNLGGGMMWSVISVFLYFVALAFYAVSFYVL